MAVTRLLFAMLGGEGGGVVTNWIMAAARAEQRPAQATSVPGVAQRTGATTYYIEIADTADGAPPPIFALLPVAGDIDIVVSSELLEAARMVERGYVAADRTYLLASTQRVLTTTEKMARGDGRFDSQALLDTVVKASRDHFLFDAEAACTATGAPVNAVLLGALAGLELLPLSSEALRGSIEAGGIAVERNLAGFAAGFAAVNEGREAEVEAPAEAPAHGDGIQAVHRGRVARLPEEAREFAALGVARLVDYQDAAYADLYLERLEVFADSPQLAREVARQLAVRMSYEDITRVAQLKARAERFVELRDAAGAANEEPLEIVDYFRPGIPEVADLLPVGLGRRLLAWADRRGIRDSAGFSLSNRSTTINGYLRIWLLAKLRRWRRRSLRYSEEQAAIIAWLELIDRTRKVSVEFAVTTAELARLVKGYGETYRRGQASYGEVVAGFVEPVLSAPDQAVAPERPLREALERALAMGH